MRYRALTVSREYGSGGAEIARIIARNLGWKLIDKELIAEIGRRGQVAASEAASFDEKMDSWIHRMARSIWGSGADGISPIASVDLFDAEKAAYLARQVIEEVYKDGECVIVGRGSQCILRDREDVYHACIYARWEDRIHRIQERIGPRAEAETRIRSVDAERTEYVRFHFKENRMNPYLYDIMIDSKNQQEKAARLIIAAMSMVPAAPSEI